MARRLVDNNARREHRRQVALLDRLTTQFRGRLERELAAAMKDMVEHWLQTNQVALPRGFHDRIEATYRQMALASITMFGNRIYNQGKARGFPLEAKESFAQIMTRLALRYISQEAIRRRMQIVPSIRFARRMNGRWQQRILTPRLVASAQFNRRMFLDAIHDGEFV